jgi:hypothetical protein
VAIAVLVIVVGLIVGVTIETFLSNRQRARNGVTFEIDSETLKPLPPRPPEARFIDDGEGFRIIGPKTFDDPGAAPWEKDDPSGSAAPH